MKHLIPSFILSAAILLGSSWISTAIKTSMAPHTEPAKPSNSAAIPVKIVGDVQITSNGIRVISSQ